MIPFQMYSSVGYLFNNKTTSAYNTCHIIVQNTLHMPHNSLLGRTIESSPNFINKVLEAQKVIQIVNDGADIEAKPSWL